LPIGPSARLGTQSGGKVLCPPGQAQETVAGAHISREPED
jgi:hypothetical protein